MQKRIYLIRHPKTQLGRDYCYGATNCDVDTDVLNATAKRTKELIKDINFDKCYCSPLIRCKKLANCLFPNIEMVYNNDIVEIDFGKWEGTKWVDIPTEAIEHWGDFLANIKPHVMRFWNMILTSEDKEIVVVTHGGVIGSILAHLLDADPFKIFRMKVDFGSVTEIVVKGKDFFDIKIKE